ncbi:hypothetical protein DID88_004431 [Monilinia fructigena]|uniref:Protein kinase domain-containing protein n=1 Tax=Monilinia fructigena TaxID=38457 RepID=A0A395IQN9_9HELO|nr:hypothetical protein DID88_004431 [Monilinia fructigena]
MGNSSGKPVNFADEVSLNHFRLLRVVGKGAFGKVRIVERKDTGLTFALKYIRKDEVVRQESVRNIIRERRMLEHLNHPFICNLRYSFQDIEYMYLVVDLMNGGDLRFHISRKTFTEEAVQFWIAELGIALKYIHKQGHIHLADFNVASDYTSHRLLTSKSGTLAYLAPEVYQRMWIWTWSRLVVIRCPRPFEGSTQTNLAAQITKAAPNFPITAPAVSMPCLHAISSALEEDPAKRMGSAGFETFTDNPFFRPIDFEALERKEIEPVFVPSSEKTNFDATYDLEELEALKDDATEKEIKEEELHKMIEAQFTTFDYTKAAYNEGGDPNCPASSHTQNISPSTPASQTSDEFPKATLTRTLSKTRKRATSRSSRSESPSNSANVPPVPSSQFPGSQQPSQNTIRTRHPYHRINNHTTAPNRPGGIRKESQGGGMQVVLGETGSWSELAKQDTTLPADAKLIEAQAKPTGMLGFLSRKKGRGHSPKPQERGILGKEGARVYHKSGMKFFESE